MAVSDVLSAIATLGTVGMHTGFRGRGARMMLTALGRIAGKQGVDVTGSSKSDQMNTVLLEESGDIPDVA